MLPPQLISCLCASLLLAINFGCKLEPQQAKSEVPPVQNQEAQAASARLKEAWTTRADKLNKTSKDYPAERLDLLSTLLDQSAEGQVRWEMEQLLANPTAEPDLSDYEHTLLETFVVRGVKQRDRELLRRVLSVKCPRFVGATPIELFLAVSHSDLPDPLLILFESYKKAANADARATLYDAISHLRELSREDFSSDQDYVSAVEAWYLENKDRVKYNPYYHPMALDAEGRILFREK